MASLYEPALAILRRAVGNPLAEFHPDQWEAIETIVQRRERMLVVQRTGWGKSAVYFIGTRLLRDQGSGPTVILSPLLALMRDQVAAAERFGVRLASINSANQKSENQAAKTQLLDGDLDAIIISPEQLARPEIRDDVLGELEGDIGLLVVDEAHCISDWGHDFRPDYKRIRSLLALLPANMPVLATTATANDRVMKDVVHQLGEGISVSRGPLTRTSLHLQNLSFPRRSQRMSWLADTLHQLPGSGIIYAATTRDAELVTNWLSTRGHSVAAYYGSIQGLNSAQNAVRRRELEEQLLNNELKALVATSALGMGYDKPDLSFVIHFQSPGSVVSYYQQVGRAGRAIPKAHGVLLSGSEDADIQEYFIANAFPPEWLVKQILDVLEQAESGLKLRQIQARINARPMKIAAALKFLAAESPSPILELRNPMRYARTLTDYELPVEAIERLREQRTREWNVMQEYLAHDGCLMQFLARELDDPNPDPCGKCANCDPAGVLPESYAHETGVAADEFLENGRIEILPRKRSGSSAADAKARFPVYKFPVRLRDEELEHEPGRALCRWGEAGWGEIAMHGKREGSFDPQLVEASAKLIRQRWKPDPTPEWLTFVPSHAHPELVPAFARGLAKRLGMPCHDVVRQVKKNQSQKNQNNSFHRSRNLDGVFEITGELPEGPVLLVDDAVDSGWTFTVIAALLRRSGSGPVIPFAIMSTASA